MPSVSKRRTALIILLFCFVHLVFTIGIAFASSANWSEVTRFTGSETQPYITDYFTCDHVDWRIRWEYMPEDATFIVYTYQQKRIVDSITEGAKVEAKIIEQDRDKKITVIKYKSKTRYMRKKGHRQPFTKIEIAKI